jgi:hypothetical protein
MALAFRAGKSSSRERQTCVGPLGEKDISWRKGSLGGLDFGGFLGCNLRNEERIAERRGDYIPGKNGEGHCSSYLTI